MKRPPMPSAALGGHEWVVAAAPGWRLLVAALKWPVVASHRCRWTNKGSRCSHTAVAQLNRARYGTKPRWWDYCADHLYGKWIENGQVVNWRLQKSAA